MLKEPLVRTEAPELTRRLSIAPDRERLLVQATFLLLGAASSVTISTVALAASYFKDSLGDNVVSQFIMAHSSMLLVVMLSIIFFLPMRVTLSTTASLLTGATLFGVGFNAFMLISLLAGQPPSAMVLFPLVAVNGGASGVIQSLSPRLGGDLPNTKGTAVGSLQLVGVSMASTMPGLIQALLLPIAAQPGRAHETAGVAAMYSLAAAGLLCLFALTSLRLLIKNCGDTVAASEWRPRTRKAYCLYASSPRAPFTPPLLGRSCGGSTARGNHRSKVHDGGGAPLYLVRPCALDCSHLRTHLHRGGGDYLLGRHLAQAASQERCLILANLPGHSALDGHQYVCLVRSPDWIACRLGARRHRAASPLVECHADGRSAHLRVLAGAGPWNDDAAAPSLLRHRRWQRFRPCPSQQDRAVVKAAKLEPATCSLGHPVDPRLAHV